MMNAQQISTPLGQQGETAAAQYLCAQGYAVITMNWRCRAGEIDIVARDGDTWVFAEVKSRRTAQPDAPFEAITPRKQARMIRAAEIYLSQHDLEDAAWRIDAIGVLFPSKGTPQIDHVKDALNWT